MAQAPAQHHPHRRAIIISPWWAGIISSVIAAGFFSCIAFAFTAYADMVKLKETVKELKEAQLDKRLTRIEDKIDYLIEKKRHP